MNEDHPHLRAVPPPTPNQRDVIVEAIAVALAPVATAWDARSQDMLDVLKDAGDARRQVRQAVRTIKVAAWLGVLTMIAGVVSITTVLEHERRDRRSFRQEESLRRLEAAQLVIKASREDAHRVESMLRESCGR
jgi:hypothetical protein